MRFTFSVDTLAIRSSGLIKSASMKRSFFPGSCVKGRKRSEEWNLGQATQKQNTHTNMLSIGHTTNRIHCLLKMNYLICCKVKHLFPVLTAHMKRKVCRLNYINCALFFSCFTLLFFQCYIFLNINKSCEDALDHLLILLDFSTRL